MHACMHTCTHAITHARINYASRPRQLRVDLDSQKRSEEYQIIVELALIEHAHVEDFLRRFVYRTVATCHG